jgi:hypothetical protein
MARLIAAIFVAWLIGAGDSARAQDVAVDIELVLAVDVSRSMDAREQQVQRQGYIAAIRHPEVIAAIKSGLLGRIAVTYFEWAGPSSQQIVVPWMMIDDETSAEAFARRIEPGLVLGRFGTSISSSLNFASGLFNGNGFEGGRRVIDVYGDGPNNIGPPVAPARDRAVAGGITINGLPIMLPRTGVDPYSIDDLNAYYRDCVVGGIGAFTLTVTAEDQFETAIRRKLIQEIAETPARVILAADPQPSLSGDCLVGERLRGRVPFGNPYNR